MERTLLVFSPRTTKPSYLVRAGDVISVRPRENLKNYYRSIISEQTPEAPDWITIDAEALQASLQGSPGPDDISLPVDANVVIEFLSR